MIRKRLVFICLLLVCVIALAGLASSSELDEVISEKAFKVIAFVPINELTIEPVCNKVEVSYETEGIVDYKCEKLSREN